GDGGPPPAPGGSFPPPRARPPRHRQGRLPGEGGRRPPLALILVNPLLPRLRFTCGQLCPPPCPVPVPPLYFLSPPLLRPAPRPGAARGPGRPPPRGGGGGGPATGLPGGPCRCSEAAGRR